jgi:hypothetical protein
MKQLKMLLVTFFMVSCANSQNLDIKLINPSDFRSLNESADTLTIVQQKDDNNIAKVKLKMSNTTVDINASLYDYGNNTASVGTDYSYQNVSLPTNVSFDNTSNREYVVKIEVPKGGDKHEELFAELKITWPDLLKKDGEFEKILIIKIIKKEKDKKEGNADQIKTGRQGDNNYFKAEVVQYTDISGIRNDKPNGLLQFQGIVKVPLNNHKTVMKGGWFYQGMRAILFDVLLNRVDKSKEEVDYNYTAYLYQNDTAKKATRPWLATTDIWRFSNLHVGARLVPFTIGKGDFRVQLQAGIKLIKNLPFSEDTVRSGIDSGKVKADFRSVYSFTKYLELYFKYYNAKEKVEISLNTGVMWLKLLDSYYEQIDIYQQDPFQKAIALSTVNGNRKSKPMYFVSIRAGKGLGKDGVVSSFVRLNYTLQTGSYLKPLSTIVDGRPISFEKKSFYNNFFQVHLGTTFDLDKIFKKDDDKKKGDGPISNSGQ